MNYAKPQTSDYPHVGLSKNSNSSRRTQTTNSGMMMLRLLGLSWMMDKEKVASAWALITLLALIRPGRFLYKVELHLDNQVLTRLRRQPSIQENEKRDLRSSK